MAGRIVLHMDLDYFYAQVEETDHPEYKGRPVVVGIYSGRDETSGAVSTSNYAARGFGVKAGVPIKEAMRKLAGKNAVFVKARHERYAEVSEGVMRVLLEYGEKFEYASVDEGVLELGESANHDFGKAEEIAKGAKAEILKKFGLTCSIGIGPNKLIAKIASDFKKPDGLTIVKPDEVQAFLDPMPVGKIPGVGAKSGEYLASLGIKAVHDLRNADPGKIVEVFGKKTGGWLLNAAKGIDDSEVGNSSEQKQISRIATLKRNTRNIEELMKAAEPLVLDIENEVKERELSFSVVGANVIDEKLKTFAKSRTLSHPTQGGEEIRRTVRELYSEILGETTTDFRRAGLKVEKLESRKGQQTLF